MNFLIIHDFPQAPKMIGQRTYETMLKRGIRGLIRFQILGDYQWTHYFDRAEDRNPPGLGRDTSSALPWSGIVLTYWIQTYDNRFSVLVQS